MQANESNAKFRFIPKESTDSFEGLGTNIASKVELKSRKDTEQKDNKARSKDRQIRRLRRSQERAKASKEREIIRMHKIKRYEPLLRLEDSNNINSSHSIEFSTNIRSKIGCVKTPNSYNKRLIKDENNGMMMSTINLSSNPSMKKEQPIKIKYSTDKIDTGDYGFVTSNACPSQLILSSKYHDVVINQPKHYSFKSNTESSSPLKRWKQHLQSDNSSRVQLLSNVFNS